MESRVTSLETRLDATLPTLATRTDIIEVESTIIAFEAKLVKWVAGIGIATVTVLVSVLGFLFSQLEPSNRAGNMPYPIIINVPGLTQTTPRS